MQTEETDDIHCLTLNETKKMMKKKKAVLVPQKC